MPFYVSSLWVRYILMTYRHTHTSQHSYIPSHIRYFFLILFILEQCYDTTANVCLDNKILGIPGYPVCGDSNFNSTFYSCADGELALPFQAPSTCGVHQAQCGSNCYDPLLYSCNSGSLVNLPSYVFVYMCAPTCTNARICIWRGVRPRV